MTLFKFLDELLTSSIVKYSVVASIIVFFINQSIGASVDLSKKGEFITILKPALYPETIELNRKNNRFLVSSFREGVIYEVNDDGLYRVLVEDERLVSVLGIAIDYENNKIFATNSDIGVALRSSHRVSKKLAALGIYDLNTGKNLDYIDLGGMLPNDQHLANGVAIDSKGNAYITDSFSPVIYKVDEKGEKSIFLQSKEFEGKGINLNGIVYHPDGYLLVVKKNTGTLFKIPIKNPNQFIKIKTSNNLVGGDGLILVNKNELIIIANKASGVDSNSVFSMESNDNWISAKVSDRYRFDDVYPTTGVIRDGKLFVIHTSLNELLQSPRDKIHQLKIKATIRQVGVINQ